MQKKRAPSTTTQAFEDALENPRKPLYVLRLYVTGTTERSVRAIRNIKRICEDELRGRYDLEVIDVYQQTPLAAGEQIVAVPTLIKKLPHPVRRFIGDLSDREKILLGLDLRTGDKPTA